MTGVEDLILYFLSTKTKLIKKKSIAGETNHEIVEHE